MKNLKNNIAKAASVIALAMSVAVIGPDNSWAKGKNKTAASTTAPGRSSPGNLSRRRSSYNQAETLSSNVQPSSNRGRGLVENQNLSGTIKLLSGPRSTYSQADPNVINSLGQKYTMIRRSRGGR